LFRRDNPVGKPLPLRLELLPFPFCGVNVRRADFVALEGRFGGLFGVLSGGEAEVFAGVLAVDLAVVFVCAVAAVGVADAVVDVGGGDVGWLVAFVDAVESAVWTGGCAWRVSWGIAGWVPGSSEPSRQSQ
jgi:hypothetical protein